MPKGNWTLFCEMRLSIIRTNWEICCCPADVHRTHAYCSAIAVQFCPHGLALRSFVAFAFGLPPPTRPLVGVGPCVLVSILSGILHWEFSVTGARGRWPMGCCRCYPFICVLLNPLTPGTFCKKCDFWTFWWFLGWISANLALRWSKMRLQHSSLPFLPPASRFSALWLGHAQKSKF